MDYWAAASGGSNGNNAGGNGASRGRNRAAWRLYEHEVRKVLALRVDFSSREIQALQL